MQGQLTRTQKYHAKRKDDPIYKEKNRLRAIENRKKKNYKDWFKKYHEEWRKTDAGIEYKKQHYLKNKETDTTVKERIKKTNIKQRELITDSYVRKIARKQLPPDEIEIKKSEILIHRIKKQIKKQKV